ncbi:MAG: OmpH family outer membrane protein [Phycisphaerales bacterium]|nr:OmpH family outer membrane protein [Phycisphaerales bacterium]
MIMKNRKAVCVMALAALMVAGGMSVRWGLAAEPGEKPPTQLAVVDIVKVFESLDEQKDGAEEVRKLDRDLKAEQTRREDSLKRQSDALRDSATSMFKPGTPEYKQAQDKLLEDSMSYRAFVAVSDTRKMMIKRLKTVELYRKINAAIEKYAKSNGIAIVFCIDELDFEGMPDVKTVQDAILTQRKIMYAHPSFDITQKLTTTMNAEYKHGTTP